MEVIAAAETWLDGQPSEFFFLVLEKVRVWSLQLVSFLVGLRTYQHPGREPFGPTRYSVESVLEDPSPTVKRLKREADHSR